MGEVLDAPQAPATTDSQQVYDNALVTIQDIQNDTSLTEEQKQQQIADFNQEMHLLGFPSDLEITGVSESGELMVDDVTDGAGAYAESSAAFALDFRPVDSATGDNGAGYQATRNGSGQVTEVSITGSNGAVTTWKLEGGQYVAYDASGNAIPDVKPASDIRTRSDGAVEIVSENQVKVINADGTSRTFEADANGNATGKPKVVERGNGEAYLLAYDDAGNLINQTIVTNFGTPEQAVREIWAMNPDTGLWELHGSDGSVTAASRQDHVDVQDDGTIVVTRGEPEAGIVERRNTDGSTVVTNADGNVISVTSPDGYKRQYEYGADQKLIRYTEGKGENVTSYSASSEDPNTFVNETTDEARTFTEVSVNADGTLVFTGTDGVKQYKSRLNQESFEFPESPGVIVRNDGRVGSVTRENGVETSFEYGGWGNALQGVTTTYPDGSYVRANLNEDGTWEIVSGGPGMPTTTETVKSLSLEMGPRGFGNGAMSYIDAEGNRVELAQDGTRRVTTPEGSLMNTSYSSNGLATIEYQTGTKTATLTQQADGTWTETIMGKDGPSAPRVADDVSVIPGGIVYTVETGAGPRRVAQYTSGVRIVGKVGSNGKMSDVTMMYVPDENGDLQVWRTKDGKFTSNGLSGALSTDASGNRVLTFTDDQGRQVTQTIDSEGNVSTSVADAPPAGEAAPASDEEEDVNAGTGAPDGEAENEAGPEGAAEGQPDGSQAAGDQASEAEAQEQELIPVSQWQGGESPYAFGAILCPENPERGIQMLLEYNNMTMDELVAQFYTATPNLKLPPDVFQEYYGYLP